ncbi:MAG: ATP-binding cassette domain-containing protein [Desulfocurvibacter africanus]
MRELLRRLRVSPILTAELLAASLCINLLAFAAPLFTIQVLNRYVTFGFDGTLVTLTAGMLLALGLMFLFRQARLKMAAVVSAGPDYRLAAQTLDILATARVLPLMRMPPAKRQEILGHVQLVESAMTPATIVAVLDLPFCLLFVIAVWLLHPALALIVLLALAAIFVLSKTAMTASKAPVQELADLSAAHRGLALSALDGAETVRAFRALPSLRQTWHEQLERMLALRHKLGMDKGLSQNLLQATAILLRVLLFALGAKLVVMGQLSIGALFGASMLGSSAFQSVSGFLTAGTQLARADDALRSLADLARLPREAESGTAIRNYSGAMELKDLAFMYQGDSGPLFESLNLTIPAGSVLLVTGYNGAGKTTFARILCGLLDPSRGQVLADGVDLRQLAPTWWRSQVIYFPQDPQLLNTSIRQNILMPCPDMEEERLQAILEAADLKRWLDGQADGMEARIQAGGKLLSEGIRRRIALARALATQGRVAIFDEPADGLDAEGRAAVARVLAELSRRGVTVVILTHDASVVHGSRMHIDLSVKPVPAVKVLEVANPRPGSVGQQDG